MVAVAVIALSLLLLFFFSNGDDLCVGTASGQMASFEALRSDGHIGFVPRAATQDSENNEEDANQAANAPQVLKRPAAAAAVVKKKAPAEMWPAKVMENKLSEKTILG